MNRNSNLQKALKNAFEGHTEPLHEAQWEGLSAAIGEKKSRKKFLPWIFSLVIIAGLSVGLGYWLGNTSGVSDAKDNTFKSSSSKEENSQSSELAIDRNLPDKDNLSGTNKDTLNDKIVLQDKEEMNIDQGRSLQDKASNYRAGKKLLNPEVQNKSNQATDKLKTDNDAGAPVNSNNSGAIAIAGNADTENSSMKLDPNLNATKKDELVLAENATPQNSQEETKNGKGKDTIVNQQGAVKNISTDVAVKPKDSAAKKSGELNRDNIEFSRFAAGITYGFSHAVYKNIQFTDPEKMHQDTRSLYSESNGSTKSSFMNLFFDVSLYKRINLTLYAGIQYRQLQSQENIIYKDNEIPFRYPDGSIFGYLFVHDTLNPTVFNNSSTLTTRFMAVPVALSYTLPIGSKNEIQFTGGVILNKILSTKGNTYSVNDGDIVNIENKYSKKMTLGYLGGLNYYRQLYRPWWVGIGIQLQQNKTSFETAYGNIKSEINITNYTFNVKYKF